VLWHQGGARAHRCCTAICIKSHREAPAGGGCQQGHQLLHANSTRTSVMPEGGHQHQHQTWQHCQPGHQQLPLQEHRSSGWPQDGQLGTTGRFQFLLLLLLLLVRWSCWRGWHVGTCLGS